MYTRRKFLKQTSCASGMALMGYFPELNYRKMISRKIPSSGEQLPIVGIGTWLTFDVGYNKGARNNLKSVLETFYDLGGRVIDSSPMYGSSESVVGDLTNELNINDKLFLATKVWTTGKSAGISQMNSSFEAMQTKVMDLMQVHNLVDAETHLSTLLEWKALGKIRYIGLTHYHDGGYSRLISLMKKYPVDFIQIDYSISNRNANNRVIPTAQEKGIAVLINRPYNGGSLFRRVKSTALPDWCQDFDCQSWGQYFLKYILSNTGVTCVIPGTSKVHHLKDNLQAGHGRLPSTAEREKMLNHFRAL